MKMSNFFGGSKRENDLLAPISEPNLLEVGKMAETRGDSVMALQLWEKHRARNPSDPVGYLFSASLLRSLKRFDAANVLLKEGLEHSPNDIPLALEYAGVARDGADWPEALKRWGLVLEKFPFHPVAVGGMVETLIKLELYPHAEALLVTMRKVFPQDYYFAVQSAVVATKQQNWSEAIEFWDRVKALKPDCEMAASHQQLLGDILASGAPGTTH